MYDEGMKLQPKTIYLISLVFLIQWGVVSAIGGASENGINNAYYYVSFGFFWAGLVLLISQTFRYFATRKPKV